MGFSEHFLCGTFSVISQDEETHVVTIDNIPCIWRHGEITREAAEMWTLIDYMSDHFNFKTFSLISYTSTKGVF
jgi:hypothetical protein